MGRRRQAGLAKPESSSSWLSQYPATQVLLDVPASVQYAVNVNPLVDDLVDDPVGLAVDFQVIAHTYAV